MKSKFSLTVAGAAIFLTIVGILSKGLGFIREVIFASYFGLSAEFDMYLVGAVLPITLNTIILYLGQNFIIPACNRVRKENSEFIQTFLVTNFYIFLFCGALIAGLLFLFSFQIVSLYLHEATPEIINSTVIIFRIYLITIPIACAVSILSAISQFNFRFNHPAYSQLILNIVYIILIVLFAKKINILIIPIGYVIGSFFQLIYLLRKSDLKFNIKGISFSESKKYISAAILTIVLIESIGQLYLLADRYFWNYIPSGGLSALNYASIIFILPISILSLALSTAMFPKISENISKRLFSELENIFNQSLRLNIAIFIPITFIMIYYGDFLIGLLFERGKFSPEDTIITHQVLVFYSISLVFYSVYSVANKMIYGLGIVNVLLYITITGIILKVILNFLLVPIMQQNGLALSTSISYIFFSISSIYFIHKKISFSEKKVFSSELIFQIINSMVSFVMVKLIFLHIRSNYSDLFEIVFFLGIILFNSILLKHSIVGILSRIITSSGIKERINNLNIIPE